MLVARCPAAVAVTMMVALSPCAAQDRVTVPADLLAPHRAPVSDAARCRQIEQSLRVPPSGRCDRDGAKATASSSGGLIVFYNADRPQTRGEIIAYTRRMGFRIVHDLRRLNSIVVGGASDGPSMHERIAAYQALPGVLSVQEEGQAELHDKTR